MITILIIDRRSSAWEQFWWEQLCWQLPYAQESAYIKIKKQEGAADAAGVTEAVLPAVNRKGTGRSTSLSMFLYRKFQFELSTVSTDIHGFAKKGVTAITHFIYVFYASEANRNKLPKNSGNLNKLLNPIPQRCGNIYHEEGPSLKKNNYSKRRKLGGVLMLIMRRDPAPKRTVIQREESWEES